MRYLLDTDVLIEILRNNTTVGEQVRQLQHAGHALCYSPVTCAELFAGLRPGEELVVGHLLSRLTCLLIDGAVGERAGIYMKTYRASHEVQLGDTLIGASAALTGAALITLNTRHYPMPELVFHHLRRAAQP